jgi:uncharacterized protein (TIGR03066 family)
MKLSHLVAVAGLLLLFLARPAAAGEKEGGELAKNLSGSWKGVKGTVTPQEYLEFSRDMYITVVTPIPNGGPNAFNYGKGTFEVKDKTLKYTIRTSTTTEETRTYTVTEVTDTTLVLTDARGRKAEFRKVKLIPSD